MEARRVYFLHRVSVGSQANDPDVGAVSEVGIKSVHNAIDKRIIGSRFSGHRSRTITDNDLLRLKLWYGVGSILSAEPKTPLRRHR